MKISRTAWPETDMEGVFGTQLQARKDLVTPRVLNAAQYAEQWTKSKYKRKAFSEDFPELYTKKNERVRSKSEILIANALADSGVPYMYEHPMKLKNGNIIYPDFRVLNVGKRKEYIWEHLGQMDRGIYAENALNRIFNYEDSGYYPRKHIIISWESSTRPLNTKTINQLIKQYLIC